MQVGTLVLGVEAVLCGSLVGAAAVGMRFARPGRAAYGALNRAVLLAVACGLVILLATHGLALRYGPLVTRLMLLYCFSLGIGLVGGCMVGLTRRTARKRLAATLGLLSVGGVALLMGLFFGRIGQVLEAAGSVGALGKGAAYEPQKNKDCPENLKSLYLAFQQYAQDWDALPPSANWMSNDDLVSKVRQNEWLHCPAVSNRHDNRYGYAFNAAISGRKLNGKSRLADLPDAAHTVLLYDSTDLGKSAQDAVVSLPKPGRHSGRDNVLYLDGHVEATTP